MDDVSTFLAACALGLVLSISTGLRAFLPLFAISTAAYFEAVTLPEPLAWMGSPLAAGTFAAAVIFEIIADKFPAVDHVMDAAHVLLKPVAGTLVAFTFMEGANPVVAAVASLATGGVVAGATHFTKAGVRLGSSATTVGAGNPVLSILEDIVAIALAGFATWGMASLSG